MRKLMACIIPLACVASLSGCAGLSTQNFSRYDKGRKIARIAVVAHNYTTADRYKMWAWTKRKPRIVPRDNFDEQIVASLAAKTDYQIISPEVVRQALAKLNLDGKALLNRRDVLAVRQATGADAILFAEVSFYLQNYLFYKTFGLVEISMRLVGTPDDTMLWEAKGRNFALFITTDSALNTVRDKMLAQLARKLESDKPMAM
ncbi:MAG: hypothetical protein NTU88_12970 [Armatimonadetes bacterium]|nr:hypothetical protein [Armatimonadota bacterium]